MKTIPIHTLHLTAQNAKSSHYLADVDYLSALTAGGEWTSAIGRIVPAITSFERMDSGRAVIGRASGSCSQLLYIINALIQKAFAQLRIVISVYRSSLS